MAIALAGPAIAASSIHPRDATSIRKLHYPDLVPHVPDFELLLDDLSQISDDQLIARSLDLFPYLALKLMRDARQPDRTLLDLRCLALAFRDLHASENGPQAFSQLLSYLFHVDEVRGESIRATLLQVAPETAGTVMTLAEKLRREGLEQGIEQGIERGLQRGKRQTLQRQLELKFGGLSRDTVARLDAASEVELDEYLERVLTADSIDAVLGR